MTPSPKQPPTSAGIRLDAQTRPAIAVARADSADAAQRCTPDHTAVEPERLTNDEPVVKRPYAAASKPPRERVA